MRLFIAINFSDATRARLLALRDRLRDKSSRGNFSAEDNLHLTLVFLGECDQRQAAAVKKAMDAVCFGPIEISIGRVGRFKRDGGDIWWAGAKESKALTDLQRGLTEKLIAAGLSPDTRPYSPHITLGREVVTVEKPYDCEPFGETASAIDLMKSERVAGKLTYTAIYTKEHQKG
ncbi:MAG: RNA 2',3'-cyclic phosphodiesterase [Defluviitaleaceae bacterium]|nr:RNA 2',3'-cyclic phosphodiesterase [Defluviitaleaceae bacterium]